MFNCYNHGWSSLESPCPICNPVKYGTATNNLIIFKDETTHELIPKARVEKLIEAVKLYIEDPDWGIVTLEKALKELGEV